MPLNANALVSLAQAKAYCDISSTDNSQNDRLEQLINMASQMIETYCNRKFKQQTHVEYRSGRLQNTLILRHWPVVKPTEIKVDQAGLFPSGTELDLNSFQVRDEMQVVYDSVFPKGYNNIKVTYQGGYAVIPSDLQEACLMLVALYYQARTDKRIGIESKGKQGESIRYIDGLPLHITAILDMFKRLEFDYDESGIANG